MNIVYVVGSLTKETPEGNIWCIEGVYSTEQLAVATCKDKNWFVGPVEMDKPLPEGLNDWPGCYYPNFEKEND